MWPHVFSMSDVGGQDYKKGNPLAPLAGRGVGDFFVNIFATSHVKQTLKLDNDIPNHPCHNFLCT
jgi:hypothetical protein